MARIDLVRQDESNARLNQQINSGVFDADTLYVVENRFVIAALATSPEDTAIAKIDTFNVIAPKWNTCSTCPQIDPALLLKHDRYGSKLGEVITFANSSPNRSYYLRSGWSWSEDWGTWSDRKIAILNFTLPTSPCKSLNLKFDTFAVKGKLPVQEIIVKINGIFYKKLSLTHVYDNALEIVFTPEMKQSKYLSIEFDIHYPTRPVDLIPDRPDYRKLGIGISTATFN
jgi:hypothetical protein